MTSDETAKDDGSLSLTVGLRYRELLRRLLAFVRAKRDDGVISAEDAQVIEGIKKDRYRQMGVTKDPADQRAVYRLEDTQIQVAAVRHAYHLTQKKLTELYPGLAGELEEWLTSDRDPRRPSRGRE